MEKLIIRPEFNIKLKELKIKTKFIKNCNDPKWNDNRDNNYSRRIQNETKEWNRFIAFSFNWHNSPEGFQYWLEISDV